MQLGKQTQRKFVKGSSAYQLSRKIDLLKKEIKVLKKSFYDNDYHDIDRKYNDLVIHQNYVMNNPLSISIWMHVSQLKFQLAKHYN